MGAAGAVSILGGIVVQMLTVPFGPEEAGDLTRTYAIGRPLDPLRRSAYRAAYAPGEA